MISKERKKEIVQNLLKQIKESSAVYFANIQKIDTKTLNKFRGELKKHNTHAQVVKKTLTRIAFNQSGYKQDWDKILQGSVLVQFSCGDPLETAKVLKKFSQENENFQILGGIVKKKFVSSAEILQLASIPAPEVLWGRLAGSLLSPLQRLVMGLMNPYYKLAVGLQAVANNK